MGIAIYLVVCLLGAALGKQFQFHNNLGQTIWVGSLGNAGVAAPNNGGFQLNAGAEIGGLVDEFWQTGGLVDEFWQTGGPIDEFWQTGGPIDEFWQIGGLVDEFLQTGGPIDEFLQTGGPIDEFWQTGGPIDEFWQTGGLIDEFWQTGGPIDEFWQTGGPIDEFPSPEGKCQELISSLGNINKFSLRLGLVSVSTDDGWAGRFWARTGCNFDGNGIGPCETGDCGNKLQCAGAGGVPPVSLAEFTLNGYGGVDYYDLSLVDGYNVPVQVIPLTKSVDPNNKYSCGSATCTAYLNNNCPNELRETNSAGATVACKSACLAFNTDQYCCRGNFGTPQTCTPSTWAQNYPAYFKNNCPGAYSYAYDDVSSTYTCQDSGYKIIFG
uniref:(California timema) hypothetical protein n=1 Tax=Timema californicum TaxID=61474 RepID=A0A7R9J9W1_TIMCA|nr:unnamed protein product [Timema californicum]